MTEARAADTRHDVLRTVNHDRKDTDDITDINGTNDVDYRPGLAGVPAGRTALSEVDGAAGVLRYRGFDATQLLDRPFEELVWLLLDGELPSPAQSDAFRDWFAEVGELASADVELVRSLGAGRHPMAALQAALVLVDRSGPDAPMAGLADHAGLRLAVRTASIVALLVDPQASRSAPSTSGHWRRFLTHTLGRAPTEDEHAAFSAVQALQLDHGLNAGTFTARTAASTRADSAAALSAAVGTLAGVLHGGADAAALADAREVGEPARAAAFVDDALSAGRRVMGMGHREYRVLDPRARIVRQLAERIAADGEHAQLLETLTAIEARFTERMAERGRPLHANLEFYKSVPYLACGIPEAAFTASFASARVFGWFAHVLEARSEGVLIRPAALWCGRSARPVTGPAAAAQVSTMSS